MKNVLQMFLALLIVGVFVAVGATRAMLGRARDKLHEAQAAASADWLKFEPQVRSDEKRWKDDPLLASHAGPNAALVMFAHVRFDRSTDPSPVPASVMDKFRGYEHEWPEHLNELNLDDVDTSWLKGLAQYGYWDLEGEGSQLKNAIFEPMSEDIPNFTDVLGLAKVHLAKGLAISDARPAARDVRELVRLCMSTESLIGEMIGIALLGFERQIYEQAVRRGHDVTGWTPVSETDALALKRLMWVSWVPYTLLATGGAAAFRPTVGTCAGLSQAITTAHYLRRYVEDELPERYAGIEEALAREKGCRLTRARVAWLSNTKDGQLPVSGAAMCAASESDPKARCAVPDAALKWPFVRPFIGVTLATIAKSDNFRLYRELADPAPKLDPSH